MPQCSNKIQCQGTLHSVTAQKTETGKLPGRPGPPETWASERTAF